jgi:hypothetical protein
MGFTHYWRRPDKLVPAKAWDAFIADVRKIFKAHEGLIAREYDLPDRAPVADDTEVRFNGIGPDGHETFHLTRDFEPCQWRKDDEDQFAFCKTARKPYNQVVTAVLSCVEHHLGDTFNVSSDGEDGEEDGIFPYSVIKDTYDL